MAYERRPAAASLYAPHGKLDELLITTSREGVEASEDPAAGSLFKVGTGVGGLTVREFPG